MNTNKKPLSTEKLLDSVYAFQKATEAKQTDSGTAPSVEVDKITFPAYWASALVNGDFSGLDEAESKRCEEQIALRASQGWRIVDVARDAEGEAQEARFTWSYHLYDYEAGVSGGEVLDYVMLKA